MVKNRHTRNKRVKRHRRRTMKGGAFSEQELEQLENSGFSERQIESLQGLGVSFNDVMQKVNTIMNEGDGSYIDQDYMTEQVMDQLQSEPIYQPIPHAEDDIHELDMGMDDSFTSQGTMDIGELNISDTSNMSGYTTGPDNSFGGKRRRRVSKKRRGKKGRKTRKYRGGGMCFGNGVGANTNDPNYSIFNTNMLKLFPYKPN